MREVKHREVKQFTQCHTGCYSRAKTWTQVIWIRGHMCLISLLSYLSLSQNIYKVFSEDIQPCNMKNRDIYWRRFKIKKHCTQDNDASVPFKVGTLGPHTVLPVTISCPVLFSWISSTVWNIFPFKDDFSFWKSQKLQGTKYGL